MATELYPGELPVIPRKKINAALDLKAGLASPTFTGTVTLPDVLFGSGGGLACGEIWVKDNVNVTTLNSASKVQFVHFDNNGATNNMTPDHTSDHITIDHDGLYYVHVTIAVENAAAQAHTINIGLFKNNGVTQFDNIHNHRNLAAGGGDRGSMSMAGIISPSATDTIELWVNTDAAANRDVIMEDVNMSIIQIGAA